MAKKKFLDLEGLKTTVNEILDRLSKKYNKDDIVYLTQAEYNALPDTKYTDGKIYFITDADGTSEATNVEYDNSLSGLHANTMQDAIDELNQNLIEFDNVPDGVTYVDFADDDEVAEVLPVDADTVNGVSIEATDDDNIVATWTDANGETKEAQLNGGGGSFDDTELINRIQNLESHTSDTDMHIASTERTNWNAAEGNANSYTDTKIATVNENLAQRNLFTYNTLSQIGMSYDNTVAELMAALPIGSMFITALGNETGSVLNGSMPIQKAGELTLTRFHGTRGIATFKQFSATVMWTNSYMDGAFLGWVKVTTNSDLTAINESLAEEHKAKYLGNGTSLLDVKESGRYYALTPSDSPDYSDYGYLDVTAQPNEDAGLYRVIRYTPINSNVLYQNVLENGTWKGWVRLATNSDLPVVQNFSVTTGTGGGAGYAFINVDSDFTRAVVTNLDRDDYFVSNVYRSGTGSFRLTVIGRTDGAWASGVTINGTIIMYRV